jgi:hypothetical protein
MPRRLPIKWLALFGAGAVIALLGGAYISLAGSAVVVDETDGVESAFIVNGEQEQPLHELWSGYFYAIPEMEGSIEVRCRDGTRKSWGYVGAHIHEKLWVIGETPCAQVVERRQS